MKGQASQGMFKIVIGRPANGTTEWRTESGQTYKDWEREQLGGA